MVFGIEKAQKSGRIIVLLLLFLNLVMIYHTANNDQYKINSPIPAHYRTYASRDSFHSILLDAKKIELCGKLVQDEA